MIILACLSCKKKIFATLWQDAKRAVSKLLSTEQDFFCSEYSSFIFQVKGAWENMDGLMLILIKLMHLFISKTLTAACLNVVPKSLAKKYDLAPPNH
jgi:putative component of membrane protein insertase Oxa1/YidC/SpoIIIJ protein YidD